MEGASTSWPELSIDDYAQRTAATIEAWKGMNGQQGGDPAKLAAALMEIAAMEQPPLRWVAGADAVETATAKANTLLEQVEAHRDLSSSLGHEDAWVQRPTSGAAAALDTPAPSHRGTPTRG